MKELSFEFDEVWHLYCIPDVLAHLAKQSGFSLMYNSIKKNTTIFYILRPDLHSMPALWSRSRTLGTRQKAFSWRIDSHGNIFIKRKFKKSRLPRIDKVSCSHLDKLCLYMQNTEWNNLANCAVKLHMGTEKEGIGKFLYRLRPEVSYAQLSSQLGAIFYNSGVWEWNKQKRGMKFLLLSEAWQEKTIGYYRFSLKAEFENNFLVYEAQDGKVLKTGQTTLHSFLSFD